MNRPSLPKCPFLGLAGPDSDDIESLPEDWTGNPFDYLPDEYTLSEEERDLAERYRSGDISGGYLRSQIACFRAPRPLAEHEHRRGNLHAVQALLADSDLKLPASFVRLVETDHYVDRIRHNNIWLDIHPKLVSLPESPECKLLQIFVEGQGCDHWSLLLLPDGTHLVCYHGETLDTEGNYPSGWKPKFADYEFFECAPSFDQWLTVYFLDCQRGDEHYAEMLAKYPGM
ncbi:hypothetical protein [Bremerella sp. P1]|uniref:hypothetical protein n=1 Tax=Bremerella sp. P1 TaxID=3026424 RepID=UPI0023681078|nr:hypothetical protein [Bremerella sp. P1]WDI42140.1 hypothetical protein PSR63_27185 [Bremerella sp. P1]